ncbi:MAG: glycosyltransferase family 9 protein [Flavobacterium sp.]|nr:glycosyltransferase family 9 protein [Flavobacterium sp.]
MKILVIQQKMIGDVLASSIICNNLRAIYPEAKIHYLVYPFTTAVIENNPNIDRIILFEDSYRKSSNEFFKFLKCIKKEKYDILIDAYGKIESHLVVSFSFAKIKIGFNKSYSDIIYNKTVESVPKLLTNAGAALENRLNLVKALRPEIPLDIKPKIFLTSEEIEEGKKVLENNEIDFSKKIFMIGVLGSGPNKTYPAPYMAEILDFIVEKSDATLLFNYIPSQINQAKEIFDLCKIETQKHIKIDFIPGNIREFLSILYHCNALIGNEGGAVNMAKAIDIPTFSIFSTWINKESWNSFEDGITHASVHLKDFLPKLYGKKSAKKMKKKRMKLYEKFVPELIFPELNDYLKQQ